MEPTLSVLGAVMIIRMVAATALADFLVLLRLNLARYRNYRLEAWLFVLLALTQIPLGRRQPVLWVWMVLFALMAFGSWLQARQTATHQHE